MAEVPTNEKLYAMVVTQAKAKYRIYPSPGASHWVHRRYIELGGKFANSEDIARRKELMQRYQERKEALLKKKHDEKGKKKSEDKK